MLADLCSHQVSTLDGNQAIEISDLIAQLDMACWAGNQFWVAALSVLLSTFALLGLLLSLQQTRRALSDARSANRAQIRPYIVIDGVSAQIVDYPRREGNDRLPDAFFTDVISRMEFNVTARVGGQSPAHHVVVSFSLQPFFASEAQCYLVEGEEYYGSHLPGDQIIAFGHSWPTGEEHDEILDARKAFELVLSIHYQDALGTDYQSDYAFEFGEHGKSAGEGKMLISSPDPERTRFT